MIHFIDALDSSSIRPLRGWGVFIFFCFMILKDPIMILLCLGIFRIRAFPHFSFNRHYSNTEYFSFKWKIYIRVLVLFGAGLKFQMYREIFYCLLILLARHLEFYGTSIEKWNVRLRKHLNVRSLAMCILMVLNRQKRLKCSFVQEIHGRCHGVLCLE